MRKSLLAGVAVLGAVGVIQGSAYAQTPAAPPAPPTPVAPAAPMMTLIPLTAGGGGKSANDNNNYQPSPISGAVATPTPGTFVIRLNGKIWSEYGLAGGNGIVTATGKGTTNAGLGTYFRLYPGFDAQATNGLRYGGQVEIRENFGGTQSGTVGAQSNTGNTGTSGLTCAQTLYVRRDFVWMSMPNIGLVRFGQGDGVSGIFDNGVTTQQGYGQGGWNGDASAFLANTNVGPSYPWYSQQGAEYGSNKIVYLTPQFFGFDFGVNYTPNNGNIETGGGTGNVPGTGDVSLASSPTPPDGTRFMNQYQVGVRYQGVFGPVSAYAFADYIGSGHVNYTGTALAAQTAAGAPAGSKYTGQFKNDSVGFVGAEFTIGGLAFGGAWQGGQYNDPATSLGTEPAGGASANAYTVGVLYTIGALSFGGSWYGFDSQGAAALAGISQRHENGFGIGANYTIAPGINPYFEGLYGTRHQGDFNFVTSSIGPGANSVHAIAGIIGIQVGW
jgi:predicted porin